MGRRTTTPTRNRGTPVTITLSKPPHTNQAPTAAPNVEATQPDWTTRDVRAIPKLDVPRLSQLELDENPMENMAPLAWLLIGRPLLAVGLFIIMALNGWWLATPIVVWAVYGSTLSAVHHLIHGSLGLSGRWRRRWLTILGCLVVESGHALQATHVIHHRDGTDLPDPEGYIENLTWREMPVGAAKYRYRLMLWGLRNSPRRRRIAGEVAFHALAHITSIALLPLTPLPWIYLTLVHIASFAFAVLQGKGPQTNWGRPMPTPLAIVHTKLLAVLFFSHHQHLEHHAYPKVPLTRLAALRPHIEEALADREIFHIHVGI